MTPVDKSQLKEGDILIYHGSKWISRAIRFLDNSKYNHASIFMDNGGTLEANPDGVLPKTLRESVDRAGSDPVSVVRLAKRPADMTPVLNAARVYMGERYAFEQVILLILVCSLRKIRRNNFFFRFVRKAIELAATVLLTITGGNRKAMICSELVYRAYSEAMPGEYDPYEITIDGRPYQGASLLASSSILNPQDNLISFFYGGSSQLLSIAPSSSPFVSPKNVAEKMNEIKMSLVAPPTDAEMEALLNDVAESYRNEDYRLDESEVIELQKSLDFFIAASVAPTTPAALMSPANIVDMFVRENANFVTPGDFVRSSSLITIGDLDLSNL